MSLFGLEINPRDFKKLQYRMKCGSLHKEYGIAIRDVLGSKSGAFFDWKSTLGASKILKRCEKALE